MRLIKLPRVTQLVSDRLVLESILMLKWVSIINEVEQNTMPTLGMDNNSIFLSLLGPISLSTRYRLYSDLRNFYLK